MLYDDVEFSGGAALKAAVLEMEIGRASCRERVF